MVFHFGKNGAHFSTDNLHVFSRFAVCMNCISHFTTCYDLIFLKIWENLFYFDISKCKIPLSTHSLTSYAIWHIWPSSYFVSEKKDFFLEFQNTYSEYNFHKILIFKIFFLVGLPCVYISQGNLTWIFSQTLSCCFEVRCLIKE